MATKIRATYDGGGLRPEQPLDLPDDTEVTIMVEVVENAKKSFLKTTQPLHLEGPPDWSACVERQIQQDSETI